MEVSEGEHEDGAGTWLLSCGHPISECFLDGSSQPKRMDPPLILMIMGEISHIQ